MTGKAKQYFEITRRGKLILADDKHHKPIFLVTEDRIPHIEATIGTIIKDDNGEL